MESQVLDATAEEEEHNLREGAHPVNEKSLAPFRSTVHVYFPSHILSTVHRGIFLDALRKGTKELHQVEDMTADAKSAAYQQIDYQMRYSPPL